MSSTPDEFPHEPDGCATPAAETASIEGESKPTSPLGHFLLYTASLPERVVRSTVGVAAGAAREAAGLLVPKSFQNSKTYEIVVCNSLKFLTENIGGVKGTADEQTADQKFMARKAVGNFVDLAGMATLHVSPVWFMAIVSDVAYGSRAYVEELASELKEKGLIDENSTIDHVDDLLLAVQNASGRAAGLFDTPPLSVDELKKSLGETRQALQSVDVRTVIPESELNRYWSEMKQLSSANEVGLLGVSGALTMHTLRKLETATRGALTGVQVAGGLLNKLVVGYYVEALHDIRERGFYESLRETSAPYVEAVWNNFAGDNQTLTEEIVSGKAFKKLGRAVKGWFGSRSEDDANETGKLPDDAPDSDSVRTNSTDEK